MYSNKTNKQAYPAQEDGKYTFSLSGWQGEHQGRGGGLLVELMEADKRTWYTQEEKQNPGDWKNSSTSSKGHENCPGISISFVSEAKKEKN